MKPLHAFHHLVRIVLRFTEALVCLTLAFLVLDVLWGVFTRYVIGEQSRWTEEVAIYLLIWVSLIGAAATYYENGHLGVDYLVQKWDPRTRRIGEFAVHVIVLLFVLYGLLYGGWQLVSEALRTGQVSAAIEVPMALVYAAVPVSGGFFTLFAVDRLLGFFSGIRDEADVNTKPEVV
jgi:TRAP-type C4-dicarboxylate transport system permease small subunit